MIDDELYNAYMVRIWQDGRAWRAQVTDVSSKERRFFTSLGQLCLFWEEQTAAKANRTQQQGDE